jgi:hypothetical protein
MHCVPWCREAFSGYTLLTLAHTVQERERVHWEEQRKAMQADMGNKAELARCGPAVLLAKASAVCQA